MTCVTPPIHIVKRPGVAAAVTLALALSIEANPANQYRLAHLISNIPYTLLVLSCYA